MELQSITNLPINIIKNIEDFTGKKEELQNYMKQNLQTDLLEFKFNKLYNLAQKINDKSNLDNLPFKVIALTMLISCSKLAPPNKIVNFNIYIL